MARRDPVTKVFLNWAVERRGTDGAWRSDAPFCLPGQAGTFVWDRTVTPPVPRRR
jgi:hypothetical protein